MSPPPRAASALAYDPASGSVILFGGRSPDLTFLADTWSFNGVSWTKLAPLVWPAARQNHVMTTTTGGLLLFGGDGKGTSLADTWTWNGTGWQVLSAAHSPSAGWGVAGMTSRDGNALMLSYASIDRPGQTSTFVQGDWVSL
jgi:Galactose oxidase, central domain